MHKTCIVVLGMHRSGTSALSGVLTFLGVNPGNSLLPPVEGVNPRGFWEHAEIVALHDKLLETLGSSWNDVSPLPEQWWLSPPAIGIRSEIIHILRRDFVNSPVWLIKDPRMCRLLPLWQGVFREIDCQPKYILALRDPAEVAHSLRKRNELDESASCLLWLTHMLEAEYLTRAQPRAFVNYERLLSDWRKTVANIGKALSIDWPTSLEAATPSVEAFLEPSLRHHANNSTLPDHPACQLALESFLHLSVHSPDPAKLDRLRAHAGEFTNLIAPWSTLLHCSERQVHSLEITTNQCHATIDRLESENSSLHSEINRIKGTVSWQITKPLRFIWNMLLRMHSSSSQHHD